MTDIPRTHDQILRQAANDAILFLSSVVDGHVIADTPAADQRVRAAESILEYAVLRLEAPPQPIIPGVDDDEE
jgi:hypothetical protein